MYKLSQLETIGIKFRELLQKAGIDDQQQLLDACGEKNARQAIAEQTGINPKLILSWAQQADLARIDGIGEEYAELLVHSGISSVQALAHQSVDKVFERLQEDNKTTHLVHNLPNKGHIASWIAHAGGLPKRLDI